MSDVSIYDLANKIISMPMMLIALLNNALFPRVVKNHHASYIKKIMILESMISLSIITCLVLFGKYIIIFLAGNDFLRSYPLVVVLSLLIPCWLIVGCYINFVYVPAGLYKYVTITQVCAMLVFLFTCILGIILVKNIFIVAFAMSFSGIFELVYNFHNVKKKRLL